MLYDPKWEVKVESFTLSGLIAWLETMPHSESYEFSNCSGRCLLGRYMSSIGIGWSPESYEVATFLDCKTDIGADIAVGRPRTFGGALSRARKAASHLKSGT